MQNKIKKLQLKELILALGTHFDTVTFKYTLNILHYMYIMHYPNKSEVMELYHINTVAQLSFIMTSSCCFDAPVH